MDLLVEKNTVIEKLSEYGLWVQDVVDHSPTVSTNFRTVTSRNGRINAGATLHEKNIQVIGKAQVPTIQDYEQLKDDINGLVIDTEPFYITKMLPESASLYDFEKPGESAGDLDLLGIPHSEYKYRWNVIPISGVNWTFLGAYDSGMLFEFDMEFTTVGLPYGMTVPVTKTVTDNIEYFGTARNNQLEYPWKLTLTASQELSQALKLEIGGRLYEFERQSGISVGDVITIDGIATYVNGQNMTQYSNFQHFELKHGNNPIVTNFVGTIEIEPYIEFYV